MGYVACFEDCRGSDFQCPESMYWEDCPVANCAIPDGSDLSGSFGFREGRFRDWETGSYTASFYVSMAGKYVIHAYMNVTDSNHTTRAVKLGQQYIAADPIIEVAVWNATFNRTILKNVSNPKYMRERASPFLIQVKPSVIYVPTSRAIGEGVFRGVAGFNSTFVLSTRDRFGNIKREGGENCWDIYINATRTLRESKGLSWVFDTNDGFYDVIWFVTAAGSYKVSVTCRGIHIFGSPFPVDVSAGPGGVTSYPYGDDFGLAEAGEIFTFHVQAKDDFDNFRTMAGNYFLVWFARAGNFSDPTIIYANSTDLAIDCRKNRTSYGEDCNTSTVYTSLCFSECEDTFGGIYEMAGLATISGPYYIWIAIRPTPDHVQYREGCSGACYTAEGIPCCLNLRGSPFDYTVQASARDTETSIVIRNTSYLLPPDTTRAGVNLTFQVMARDRFHNNLDRDSIARDERRGIVYTPLNVSGVTPIGLEVVPRMYIDDCAEYYRTICLRYAPTERHAQFDIWASDLWGPYDLRNGLLDIMFYTTVAAEYTISVRDLDGKHARYSPFVLDVLPGEVVYGKTLVPCGSFCANCLEPHSGLAKDRGYSNCGKTGLDPPTAGVMFTFYVQARDYFGNNLTSGNITFDIQLRSDPVNPPAKIKHALFGFNTGSDARLGTPGTSITQTLNKDGSGVEDGTFLITLFSQESGVRSFSIQSPAEEGSQHIRGSPFVIDVLPDASLPGNTIVDGQGLSEATAGVRETIFIQARDQFGNNRRNGGDTLTMETSGWNMRIADCVLGRPECTYMASIIDSRDGSYNASYMITYSAVYQWRIAIEGVNVWNHNLQTYEPWAVLTSAAQSYPPYCTFTGIGRYGGYLLQRITFSIKTRDQFYNERTDGALWRRDNFEVTIVGASDFALEYNTVLVPNITDPNTGVYDVAYQTTVSGLYYMSAFLDYNCQERLMHPDCGKRLYVYGSPVDAYVIADNITAELSYGYDDAYAVGVAGENETFSIQAVDIRGNKRTQGKEVFVVQITGPQMDTPSNLQVAQTRNDGTFETSYLFTIAGQYMMTITLGQVPIKDIPSILTIKPAIIDAQYTVAVGSGLTIATAGLTSSFSVIARDRFGNLNDNYVQYPNSSMSCTETLEVLETKRPRWTLFSACYHGLDIAWNASTDGRYLMTYMSTRAGQYQIFIAVDNEPIFGSPYSDLTIVANDVNIPASIAVGIMPAFADDWYTNELGQMIPVAPHFAVVVRDDYGNQRPFDTPFTQAFFVEWVCTPQRKSDGECVKDLIVSTTYENNYDGSFGVQYTATVTGYFRVSISFDQVHISGSPFDVMLSAGRGFPTKILATGRGVQTPERRFVVRADDLLTDFRLQTWDRYSNRVTYGGENFNILVTHTDDLNKRLHYKVEDHDDGTYTIRYNCTRAGFYHISIMIDLFEIHQSPFKPQVYPGVTVTTASVALGRALIVAEIDSESTFIIQARDQFTNDQTGCDDFFDLEILGGPLAQDPYMFCDGNENGLMALSLEDPDDPGDGKHRVTYIAMDVQVYVIWIMQAGIHIHGSPFNPELFEASRIPEPERCFAVGDGLSGTVAGAVGSYTIQARNVFGIDLTAGNIVFETFVQFLTQVRTISEPSLLSNTLANVASGAFRPSNRAGSGCTGACI